MEEERDESEIREYSGLVRAGRVGVIAGETGLDVDLVAIGIQETLTAILVVCCFIFNQLRYTFQKKIFSFMPNLDGWGREG